LVHSEKRGQGNGYNQFKDKSCGKKRGGIEPTEQRSNAVNLTRKHLREEVGKKPVSNKKPNRDKRGDRGKRKVNSTEKPLSGREVARGGLIPSTTKGSYREALGVRGTGKGAM